MVLPVVNSMMKVQQSLESFHLPSPLQCALVRRQEPLRESEWRAAKNDPKKCHCQKLAVTLKKK